MNKWFAILTSDTGERFVLDEYYPTDHGRCHVLGDTTRASYIAHFHRDDMTLDYKKVSIDIALINFMGTSWPFTEMKSRSEILAEFGITD
jgi:hypothetical protein